MTLPNPKASRMDNLIATMLLHDNYSWSLKDCGLDRIAAHQGFDPASFKARFLHIETAFTLKPRNDGETLEGK